jgi:hypothetical protein
MKTFFSEGKPFSLFEKVGDKKYCPYDEDPPWLAKLFPSEKTFFAEGKSVSPREKLCPSSVFWEN